MAEKNSKSSINVLILLFIFVLVSGENNLEENEENALIYSIGRIIQINNFTQVLKYEDEVCYATPLFHHWRFAATTCSCTHLISRQPLAGDVSNSIQFQVSYIPLARRFFVEQKRGEIKDFPSVKSEIVLTIRHKFCQKKGKIFRYNIGLVRTASSLRRPDPRIQTYYRETPTAFKNDMINQFLGNGVNCWTYRIDQDEFKMYRCNVFKEQHNVNLISQEYKEHGDAFLCLKASTCKFSPGLPICCGTSDWPSNCYGVSTQECQNGQGIQMPLLTEFLEDHMRIEEIEKNWEDAKILFKEYDSTPVVRYDNDDYDDYIY